MMIRINLNPARKTKGKSNYAKIAVVVTLVVVVAVIGGFMAVESSYVKKASMIQSQVTAIDRQINVIKSRIADNKQILQKKDELQKRQNMLVELASIRRGPQYVLNEFSRILSNPRDVVARKEASENGWLLAWEPENIIIQSLKSLTRGKIQIVGIARTMDDIYEFWTRMKTSKLLRNVVLVEIQGDDSAKEQTQKFVFTMDANFNYRTSEGIALIESLSADNAEKDGTKPEA